MSAGRGVVDDGPIPYGFDAVRHGTVVAGIVASMGAAVHMSLLMSALLMAGTGPVGAVDREAERLAEAAIVLCNRADRLPADARPRALRRGLGLAERAVRRDGTVGRAHFAVFCTLGKLVDLEGVRWGTLGSVRRVRRAIERALALAPDDVDVLVGKGALLLRLPRLLGGDQREAERYLARALEIDPRHVAGRSYLAQIPPTLLSTRRAE